MEKDLTHVTVLGDVAQYILVDKYQSFAWRFCFYFTSEVAMDKTKVIAYYKALIVKMTAAWTQDNVQGLRN
jgi:hypothetical protein